MMAGTIFLLKESLGSIINARLCKVSCLIGTYPVGLHTRRARCHVGHALRLEFFFAHGVAIYIDMKIPLSFTEHCRHGEKYH